MPSDSTQARVLFFPISQLSLPFSSKRQGVLSLGINPLCIAPPLPTQESRVLLLLLSFELLCSFSSPPILIKAAFLSPTIFFSPFFSTFLIHPSQVSWFCLAMPCFYLLFYFKQSPRPLILS